MGLLEDRPSRDRNDSLSFVERLNLSHHVGNPIGFRSDIDVRDGHPISRGVFNRPLTSGGQSELRLMMNAHGHTSLSIWVVERVKNAFCAIG